MPLGALEEVVDGGLGGLDGLAGDDGRVGVLGRFEDGQLEVDVYLDAPDDPDPAVVADEAVEAAEAAVDDLFEGT